MKILSFMGSPRIKGNTDILLDYMLEAAQSEGAIIKNVKLITLKYRGCIECGDCDSTGICSLKDDFTPLYDEIVSADAIVIASPIFFYNITSLTQMAIERAQALWVAKYRLKKQLVTSDNKLGIFVGIGASKGKRLFDGARLVVKYFFDAIGVKTNVNFLVKGVEKKSEVLLHKHLLEEVIDFGKKICHRSIQDRLIII